jgi:hypothetical protein
VRVDAHEPLLRRTQATNATQRNACGAHMEQRALERRIICFLRRNGPSYEEPAL